MPATAARPRRGRLVRRVLRTTAALLILGIGALAIAWWLARPAAPDAFYAVPDGAPREPGALLRQEAFAHAVPDGARAWRILYATTRADGTPAVASAIVLASADAVGTPRPVVAWAHGTTGIAPGCAPSVLPNPFLHVPALPELLAGGWVYVGTDYVGLGATGGHAYLVGEDAARSVLDSVRAARQIEGLRLDGRTVVWGHSQGGNSALWTGIRAPEYAPDVPLAGVAALAPASDLPALVSSAQASAFGKIVSAYLTYGYDLAYTDAAPRSYLRPGATLVVGDLASRCVGGWETIISALETFLLPSDGIFARPPAEGAFGARLAENVPRRPIAAPLFIAQGKADDLVLPEIQDGYVAARCAAGQAIDYRTYAGRDHISLLAADSPLTADLVAWTRDRLSGSPAPTSCAPP